MKKCILLILGVILMLSFCGCGKPNTSDNSDKVMTSDFSNVDKVSIQLANGTEKFFSEEDKNTIIDIFSNNSATKATSDYDGGIQLKTYVKDEIFEYILIYNADTIVSGKNHDIISSISSKNYDAILTICEKYK